MAIKRLQPLDRRALDVALLADRGVAVIVPLKHGGQHPLIEHATRAVLAALEFIAHHAELLFQVGPRDEGIDHAICLELERPAQVFLRGSERLVVIGAIEPRRAVGPRAMLGQFLRDVWVLRRAFEDEVLQQMRHARFRHSPHAASRPCR